MIALAMIFGAVVGGFVSALAMAIMCAASDADDALESWTHDASMVELHDFPRAGREAVPTARPGFFSRRPA